MNVVDDHLGTDRRVRRSTRLERARDVGVSNGEPCQHACDVLRCCMDLNLNASCMPQLNIMLHSRWYSICQIYGQQQCRNRISILTCYSMMLLEDTERENVSKETKKGG